MDISNRADIERLVNNFYQKAMKDPLIGHFFTSVVILDLDKHLPIICDFWESTLLGNLVYKRNPMLKHIELAEKSPMKKEHFDRWLELWQKSIDELFDGETANVAKSRARQIAQLMFFKVSQN